MITKEVLKAYIEHPCPRLVYMMANDQYIYNIIKKMVENKLSSDEVMEDSDTSEDENKINVFDSIYELLRLHPEIKKQIDDNVKERIKAHSDQVTTFIDQLKDYMEVSSLSRRWASKHFKLNIKRADTYDGTIDGLSITNQTLIEENTQKYLKDDSVGVILEGQVHVDNFVSRWDILVKTENGYEIYECKGTTNIYKAKKDANHNIVISGIKPEYLYDMAFQYDVYKLAGLKIASLNFLVLNSLFKLSESEMSYPIDDEYLEQLFTICNQAGIKKGRGPKATTDFIPILDYIEKEQYVGKTDKSRSFEYYKVAVKNIVARENVPDSAMLYCCRSGGGCILMDDCHPKSTIPDDHILKLTAYGAFGGSYTRNKKLMEDGILSMADIPENFLEENYPLEKETDEGIRKKTCARLQIICSKGRYDHPDFVEFKLLDDLLSKEYQVFPLIFFDFESFSYPIPLVENSRPWQQVCSQYSMHVVQQDYDLFKHDFEHDTGGGITHYEYIGHPFADGFRNPERNLLTTLKAQLAKAGVDWTTGKFTLIVYNKNFESTRFKEMGEDFPEEKEFCEMCRNRIVDLLDFFTRGYWYRKDFNGKCSLKITQPSTMKDAIIKSWLPPKIDTTLKYDTGLIHNGGVALDVYHSLLRAHDNGTLEKDFHDALIRELLHYCKIDSWGTVILYDIIKQLSERHRNGTLNLPIDTMNLLPK